MSLKRIYGLLSLDLSDTIRPPLLYFMVFVITLLSVVLAYVQLFSTTESLAMNILRPTLLATALFLALRGASGISQLVSNRVMEVYLSYPVSRLSIAIVLYISRVVVPSILLITIPLLAAGIVLEPLVVQESSNYILMGISFLVQALFYGSVFVLIALVAKSTGTTSILSLLFYFSYNIIALILSSVSSSVTSTLFRLAQAMSFYMTVYNSLTTNIEALRPYLWEYLLVPSLTSLSALAFILIMSRRFEP
ncbi:MAG: hypothetical protein F7C36_06315 [Desulfurococcales archaeon]|nr:hypothetical protein [Desulfurococcales archaeon]